MLKCEIINRGVVSLFHFKPKKQKRPNTSDLSSRSYSVPAVIREHGDEVCGWWHTKRSDKQKHLQPGRLHISFHPFFCRKSVAFTWNQKRVQQQCCDQSLRLVYGAADKELLSLFSLVGSAWFFFSTVDSNPFTPRSQQLKLEFQPDI